MREIAALALFLLAVYGLATAMAVLKTRLVVRAIFGGIPVLKELVNCPPCLAFWIGMACSVWVLSPAAAFVGAGWRSAALDGLAACGATWLLHLAAERTGKGLDL